MHTIVSLKPMTEKNPKSFLGKRTHHLQDKGDKKKKSLATQKQCKSGDTINDIFKLWEEGKCLTLAT